MNNSAYRSLIAFSGGFLTLLASSSLCWGFWLPPYPPGLSNWYKTPSYYQVISAKLGKVNSISQQRLLTSPDWGSFLRVSLNLLYMIYINFERNDIFITLSSCVRTLSSLLFRSYFIAFCNILYIFLHLSLIPCWIHLQCRKCEFGRSPGRGATLSSTLAWRLPWAEEPGGLPVACRVTESQTRLKLLSI